MLNNLRKPALISSFLPLAIGLIALAVIFFSHSEAPADPTIRWTPRSINETILAGQSKTIPVSFVADDDITTAEIRITPPLQPYVKVNSLVLGKINEDQKVSFDIILSPPPNALPGTVKGTIQIRGREDDEDDDYDGRSRRRGKNDDFSKKDNKPLRTFARPLPVTLIISWASFTDNVDGYRIEIPPSLQTANMQSVRPAFLRGTVFDSSTEMLNLSVATYDNSAGLPVDVWYSDTLANKEYLFPDSTTRSTATVLIDGIPSLEVTSTLLGFIKLRTFVPVGNKVIALETSVPDDSVVPIAYFKMLESFSVF